MPMILKTFLSHVAGTVLFTLLMSAAACQPRAKVPISRPRDPITQTQEEPKKIESPASGSPRTGVERTGGGGHNTILAPRKEIVEKTLKHLRLTLTWALNKSGISDDVQLKKLIWEVEPHIERSGPCFWNGEHFAGTADVEAKKICLSIPLILEQVAEDYSTFASTLALGLHEYCHLLGKSHAECEVVQKTFKQKLGRPGDDFMDGFDPTHYSASLVEFFRKISASVDDALLYSNMTRSKKRPLTRPREEFNQRSCSAAEEGVRNIFGANEYLTAFIYTIYDIGLEPPGNIHVLLTPDTSDSNGVYGPMQEIVRWGSNVLCQKSDHPIYEALKETKRVALASATLLERDVDHFYNKDSDSRLWEVEAWTKESLSELPLMLRWALNSLEFDGADLIRQRIWDSRLPVRISKSCLENGNPSSTSIDLSTGQLCLNPEKLGGDLRDYNERHNAAQLNGKVGRSFCLAGGWKNSICEILEKEIQEIVYNGYALHSISGYSEKLEQSLRKISKNASMALEKIENSPDCEAMPKLLMEVVGIDNMPDDPVSSTELISPQPVRYYNPLSDKARIEKTGKEIPFWRHYNALNAFQDKAACSSDEKSAAKIVTLLKELIREANQLAETIRSERQHFFPDSRK